MASAAGQALQSNEYYPFGGMIVRNVPDSSHCDIDDSGVNPLADDFLNEEHFAEDDVISLAHSDQPYKFSGKEFIEDNGLNLYNFGARFYNPVNCRFTTMDPLAEKYFSISPYAYCNNNPVIFVDPDGKSPKDRLLGYVIGVSTNLIPGASVLRDLYSPDSALEYNSALESADELSLKVGISALTAGMGTALGGGQVAMGGVVAAPTGAGVVAAAVGAEVSITGGIVAAVGANVVLNASYNSSQGYNRGAEKSSDQREITFIQGKGENARKITTKIPKGYRLTKYRSHGKKVYYNGKDYISPDKDGHNGGIWKKAKSLKDLNNNDTRLGTYTQEMDKIHK
ncbi:MAG: toxin C-terminal domain-containing protein [Bacteroidales bacterium]|nr:toxin C-terminal domain-containing protein [Bacteroidales bacterium]